MEGFYYLNFAAAVLSAFLYVLFLIRKSFPTLRRKMRILMFLLTFLSAIFEIFKGYALDGTWNLPIGWKNFFVILFSIVHLTLHFCFVLYALACTKGSFGSKATKITLASVYVATVIFIILNPVHNMVFTFNGGDFSSGKLSLVVNLISSLTLAYSLALVLIYRKRQTKIEYSLNIFFLVTWLGAVALELIWPKFLCENFVVSIAFCMLAVIYDNPSQYFVGDTGIYNEFTFDIIYKKKLANNNGFKVIALTLEDLDIYIHKYGREVARKVFYDAIKFLGKRYGTNNVFGLRRYVICIDCKNIVDIDKECDELYKIFYRGDFGHQSKLKLTTEFVTVSCPEDCTNIADLHTAINLILFEPAYRSEEIVTHFDSNLLKAKHRREEIVVRLYEAIENDHFEVHFQPLYDVKKDKYTGLEGLIRFKREAGQIFSPGEFIPIAEEEGLIFDIDDIVFEKTCRFIRNSNLKDLGVEFINVNCSLLTLLDSSTVDRYAELCARYDVDPSYINLEITETAEGDSKYRNIIHHNIEKFRKKGFNFSIDDFGSGYSTTIYLAEIDAALIKIDASILWNAMKNKKYYTILENTVELVSCFNKRCLVEGVEDEEMVKVLNKLGVNYQQGFLYSKPVNEEKIVEILKEKNFGNSKKTKN